MVEESAPEVEYATQTPERAAAKEAIKLDFISGKGALAQLSVRYKIPYQTVLRWSKNELWSDQKSKFRTVSDSKLTENLADFIAEQRTAQIKRAIARSGKLQGAIDKALTDELTPADIQALASAEERMDNVIRRNLGMDQQSGGGNSVSINILAQGVQLA